MCLKKPQYVLDKTVCKDAWNQVLGVERSGLGNLRILVKKNQYRFCEEPEDGYDDRKQEGRDARRLQLNPQNVKQLRAESLPTKCLKSSA